MRSSYLFLCLALPLLFSVAACSSTTTRVVSGGDPDAEAPSAGGDPTAADAGAVVPTTPKGYCEALIACVADIDATSAGPLVTLYGDASNCWKGSAADAEACGKACKESLDERSACMAAPLDRHYLAICASSGTMSDAPLLYDVALRFHARTGGDATFRPLRLGATTYRAGDALATAPKMQLAIRSSGGAGAITSPFDVPSAAFFPPSSGAPSTVRVEELAVERLRIEKKVLLCSDIEGSTSAPIQTQLRGSCVYLPLADGAPVPDLSRSAITSCDVGDVSGGGMP